MIRIRWGISFAVALAAAVATSVPAPGQAPGISGYELISTVRVTRTVDQLTYRAVLTNGPEGLAGASALATSTSAATTIVDGSLAFGPLGPGASVVSSDTFSFRHDRTVPFSWANIRWAITTQRVNHPPTANAGPDQTADLGSTVTADGSASADVDGDTLTFAWTIQSGPVDGATLSNATSPSAVLHATVAGTYVLSLTVSDPSGANAVDTATVTIRDTASPPEFTFTLAAAAISMFANSSAVVTFTVSSQSGLTVPLTVTVVDLPSGMTIDEAELPAGLTHGSFAIGADETVPVGEASIVVSASAGGTTHTAPLTVTVRAAEPRAQEKIREAFIEGTIDRLTSLLYRAYALVGDPRLPDEFLGSGSEDEDGTLIQEINEVLDTAPAQLRTQLEAFTLRPANPNSWYGQQIGIQAAVAPIAIGADAVLGESRGGPFVDDAASGVSLQSTGTLPSSCFEDTTPTNGWISKRSPNHPFRIWSHCVAGDPNAAAIIVNYAAPTFERIWSPMTASVNGGMGDPLPDLAPGAFDATNGVGDEAIDIYLIFPGDVVSRLGQNQPVLRSANGWAIPTGGGAKTSGFVTLPVSTVLAATFHMTATHELFHVLQFAHNAVLAGAFVLPGFEGFSNAPRRTWWYVEASATWAAAHFDRTLAAWPRGRQANRHVYLPWFTTGFQRRDSLTSLNSPSREPYEAFIWPYFMEQRDSATRPAQVWTVVEGATGPRAADEAMDGIFSFHDEFREFAKRDLNKALDPGNALPQRFVHLDDDSRGFRPADGILPIVETRQLTGGTIVPFVVNVAALSAQHAKFDVADTRIRKIEFDLQALNAQRDEFGLDVDGFVKIKGGSWQLRDLNNETKLTFCLDEPEQDLESLRLVVSNHTLSGATAHSSITVTSTFAPCEGKWVGTAVFDTQYKLPPNAHSRMTANITWTRGQTFPGSDLLGIQSFLPSGSVAVDVFEANGCVASVAPRTALIESTDGLLQIDYTVTPNVATGYGGKTMAVTLTDCQGRSELVVLGMIFMDDGPLELNDKGDELVKHIVVIDDASSIVTLDLSYKRIRQ